MGFRKVKSSCAKDGLPVKMVAHTHICVPSSSTHRKAAGIHNKKRCTTGLKTKDPREKTQPGTRIVGEGYNRNTTSPSGQK